MEFLDKDSLWAGTQSSLESALAIQAKLQDQMLASILEAKTAPANTSAEAPSEPSRYEVSNGVAVIPVKGPLLNWDASEKFASAFGITTYPMLQRAFHAAAGDKSVKSVMLDINSPGGSVAGISDTIDALQALRASKPVSAFAGDLMASAGYWLGSTADHITATKMSTVGSIGVIGTHLEFSKQLAQEGVTPTVLRAGEYKALSSPYEQLTDKARAQLQERLDAVYAQFVDHVATQRQVSYPVAHSNMANGKEFFGEAALHANLVDSIGKFPDALAFAAKRTDNANIHRNNTLSAQSGDVQMTDINATQIDPAEQEQSAPADAQQTPAAQVPVSNELVTYLTNKVDAQQAQLSTLTMKVDAQQVQLASMDALRTIAEASLNQMRIALGHSAMDAAAFDAGALVAEHTRMAAEYSSKFPVGGIAAGSVDTQATQKTEVKVDPTHLARVQATRFK